jgi:hypothetical protein
LNRRLLQVAAQSTAPPSNGRLDGLFTSGDVQNGLKGCAASLPCPRDNPILGKTLDNALRENIMIQQAYYTSKFAGQAQVQAARRPSLLRTVINYFRKGWDDNLAYAEVVGKSGSYLG